MSDFADFYGIAFEADYLLFSDEFEDLPAVYVVYTQKSVLDIGITEKLKTALEEHKNTRDWLKLSNGEDIFIAFNIDEDESSRKDKEEYLRVKMNPLL